MHFENFITSGTGLVHFIIAMIAMVSGTMILVLPKGTPVHRRIGRIYGLSMLVVLGTSFTMYRLFGTWGIFHWTAVISGLTLLAGMIPILLRRPAGQYRSLHFSFMYWSVMGVYAAFVSETLVRMPGVAVESGIPNAVFYNMTGIGTALVMGLAVYFFLRFRPRWEKVFGETPRKNEPLHR